MLPISNTFLSKLNISDKNITQTLAHRNIQCNYIESKDMNYLIVN